MGERFSAAGFNAMTFNYRGTYRSTGKYSLKNSQEDIQAAFNYLREPTTVSTYRIDLDKLVLGGWSYGGGMALIYAANHPKVSTVFSIAGTDHGEFAREYRRNEQFSDMVDAIFEEIKKPHGPVNFSGKTAIREELIRNPDPYDLLSQVDKLVDRRLLLIGGWDDPHVIFEHHTLPCYRALKELGAGHIRLEAIQDNHAFENSREQLATTITGWINSIYEAGPSTS